MKEESSDTEDKLDVEGKEEITTDKSKVEEFEEGDETVKPAKGMQRFAI